MQSALSACHQSYDVRTPSKVIRTSGWGLPTRGSRMRMSRYETLSSCTRSCLSICVVQGGACSKFEPCGRAHERHVLTEADHAPCGNSGCRACQRAAICVVVNGRRCCLRLTSWGTPTACSKSEYKCQHRAITRSISLYCLPSCAWVGCTSRCASAATLAAYAETSIGSLEAHIMGCPPSRPLPDGRLTSQAWGALVSAAMARSCVTIGG